MHVSPQAPFQIIYALFQHQYLGYLFESFVVQLDEKGNMTLKFQNISSQNASEFMAGLDEQDFELIRLMDDMQQDVVAREFSQNKLKTVDFFLKIYDPETGDKELQAEIVDYLEKIKRSILELMKNHGMLFVMGSDGTPTYRQIDISPIPASLLFHFRRNHESTLYFPTMKHNGAKVEFQFQNAGLIASEPAWMLLKDRLYHFDKPINASKIKPFLHRSNIIIPRKIEETYFQKFVAPLIETVDVVAKGFNIERLSSAPHPILNFKEILAKPIVIELFGQEDTPDIEDTPNNQLVFTVSFNYGKFTVPFSDRKEISVVLEKQGDDFVFYKVRRDLDAEQRKVDWLELQGLDFHFEKAIMPKSQAIEWLCLNEQALKDMDFTFEQQVSEGKRYFIGKSSLSLEVREGRDWFDIYAKVRFGDYEIPFLKIRDMILGGIHEFELPNGEIALIPETWFAQYADVFNLMQEKDGEYILQKQHLSILQDLHEQNYAQVEMNAKLLKLRDFEQIDDYDLPENFRGTLRPYQKAGYNWLQFLHDYKFGGCLADDMGLGKTVQTLAFLQDMKEKGADRATLLVLPTSLIYNWEQEAQKFVSLKVLNYTGTYRNKNTEQFADYDLILTSYGIVRLDIDMLITYHFNYVILDESQAIKNPNSNIAQAVKMLQSNNRLILTGTPIENSTVDLWSQMSFINTGLLGDLSFFKKHFQTPIEKRKDVEKIHRLHTLIKPFILRRQKSQVAKDLPEKIEAVHYSRMTEEQETVYEETKSRYRNLILKHIEEKGLQKSQMLILKGLIELRQLANHPKMIDESYEHESGKMNDVIEMIETAVSEDHKILVFSQFVKHLNLVKAALNERKIPFAYLDGNTRNRQAAVEEFQGNVDIPVFLISLKAGGVGLNLTAADYVFILDPWWNPAVELQAIDRAHRIGQENTVMIYKFITQNSVEEKILSLQRNKLHLATELISSEEGFMKSLTQTDIEQLLM